MEKRTTGTILAVKKQWWLKINTKAVRIGVLDGAIFPHIVKVKYDVDGNTLTRRKWLSAWTKPPYVNDPVTVIYREDKPTKFRLEF